MRPPAPLLDPHLTRVAGGAGASFLTGRIPGHGIQETNLGMTAQTGNNKNLTMIAKKLTEAGYYTAQVGKCAPCLSQPLSFSSGPCLES